MRYLFSLLCFASYSFMQDSFNTKPKAYQDPPIIDLTINYPERNIFVDKYVVDWDFIPLKTTTDVLDDRYFRIVFASYNRIVGYNSEKGDIFIFDMDGKLISSFNHQGNSEIGYLDITSLVYDENRKEIFVSDAKNNQCLVYSENGKFLRQFYYPKNSHCGKDMFNFDDQTLLGYVSYFPYGDQMDVVEINQKKPYLFLSKEDGSIVSRLDILFPKRIPVSGHVIEMDSGLGSQKLNMPTNNIDKNGQNFIICDRSSDTIYLLTQDKKLTPLFVRTPSVFDTKKVIYLSVVFNTDKFVVFSTSFYDFTQARERIRAGQSYGHIFTTNMFAYDIETGQISKPINFPRSLTADKPFNTCVLCWANSRFIDLLIESRFINERKFKQISQTIKDDEEVNSVVQIIKFR